MQTCARFIRPTITVTASDIHGRPLAEHRHIVTGTRACLRCDHSPVVHCHPTRPVVTPGSDTSRASDAVATDLGAWTNRRSAFTPGGLPCLPPPQHQRYVHLEASPSEGSLIHSHVYDGRPVTVPVHDAVVTLEVIGR